MIDIIIPVYNNQEIIIKTLSSICLQDIKNNIHVYIINNNSNNNYREIIDLFKNTIKITELRLLENRKTGYVKQYGLDNSNGKYIIFIDCNDVFYDAYSIESLYNAINDNNADLISGLVHEVINDKTIITNGNQNYLYGKIYKREYINNNNIKFNDTDLNEDKSFNQLFYLSNPKMYYIQSNIYVHKIKYKR